MVLFPKNLPKSFLVKNTNNENNEKIGHSKNRKVYI